MTSNSYAEASPVQAKRVLVPVANPATAPGLLRLGWKLAQKDAGKILALFVQVSSQDAAETTFESIEAVVNDAQASDMPVEMLTVTAPSPARGILDAAREYGASLMVLGFQSPGKGRVDLGPIVEAVARTTPCDLVVYRNPQHMPVKLDDIERIVLPLDGSDNSRVAARLGMVLADVFEAQPAAIYVQTDPDLPSWFGLARIEASLTGLQDTRQLQRQVVRANDRVSGILSRCDSNDMIVLGYSEKSSLDRWIFGNVAQRMLAQAPGPVILAKRATREQPTLAEQIQQRYLARFRPRLTPSERTDIVRQANELNKPGINFVVLMIVSSILASLGLMQNSSAVIIGAMLVAPLMSPLVSFSVGLIQGRLRVMRDAAVTTGIGVLIGLGVAVTTGIFMPLHLATTEMLARGQPTLLDMGVALASGVAGAFATARKDIPAALAGVAIAAALVPPLCTVGLALAFGQLSLASGAALLFLTNIVSIALASAAVFAWLGLIPGRESTTRRRLIVALLILLVLAIPLGRTLIDVIRLEQDRSLVRTVLQDHFSDADVSDIDIQDDDVSATIRSSADISPNDVLEAEKELETRLGYDIVLRLTHWRLIEPSRN